MTGSSPANDENPPWPPFPKGGHEFTSLWKREVRRDFVLRFYSCQSELKFALSLQSLLGCHISRADLNSFSRFFIGTLVMG
jgi:hypothetical protein